ncbi:hypothetical protein M758_1G167000 [Ceratodon purpureus]|nr:hypothetical protein M758_1G167000 [Ceratodon purpureus]
MMMMMMMGVGVMVSDLTSRRLPNLANRSCSARKARHPEFSRAVI